MTSAEDFGRVPFQLRPSSNFCSGDVCAVGEVTMPVQSLPVRDAPLHFRLLQQYLLLLKKYPILTKSVTSGILSALGNLLSQIVEARKKVKNGGSASEIDAAGAARYAIYGLLITGPVSHYFYQLMEVWMPSTDPYCLVKRLLLDRLFFAPGFLLIFYFVMNILEVGHYRLCAS
ncbi:peroxisomal membrane protein 2 [Scomber scombrus]|uniref:Peroxisomal membrane protein 2 n=1 Tax=Scomber scombrus TaxID=13677 RepID=A0AAV1P3Z2_SCOSC